jgi:uncharacterized protein (TIGR00297 family)
MAGGVAAVAVALAARAGGALSTSGAIAAALVGWAAVVAGVDWAVTLIAYFVATSALSRWRRDLKSARSGWIIEKGTTRDATQVLSNGGVMALAAAGSVLAPGAAEWIAIGIGALAASAADSWATEVGIAVGGVPRSVIGGRRVPPGTSGAVTVAGTLASLIGAAFVAGVAVGMGLDVRTGAAVAAAGAAGAAADSILGAVAQGRRWCGVCEVETEQRTHRCGNATRELRGLRWLDNDGVNLIATAVGALTAWLLAR